MGVRDRAGVVVAIALSTAVAAHAKDYPGVLPKPLFATPDRAAYCYIDGISQEDRGAMLLCWTPNDGFAASISWRSNRAGVGYFTKRPQIVHALGVLKRYRPSAPVLRFGQRRSVRCANPAEHGTCAGKQGRLTFECISRRTGLTCTNTRRHGFWLGRFKGYRLF